MDQRFPPMILVEREYIAWRVEPGLPDTDSRQLTYAYTDDVRGCTSPDLDGYPATATNGRTSCWARRTMRRVCRGVQGRIPIPLRSERGLTSTKDRQ